jgi:YD repeat-containing protein
MRAPGLQPIVTRYSYTVHPNGMLATMIEDGPLEGAGDAVTYQYDAYGQLGTLRNSLGHTTTYSGYTALGMPTHVEDANGAITEFGYDARGRMVSKRNYINGQPADVRFTYGSSGLLEQVTPADGPALRYAYDEARRLTDEFYREQDGTYARKRYGYNPMSQVTAITVSQSAYTPVTRVIGTIEGIGIDRVLRGWACTTGTAAPIHVQVFADSIDMGVFPTGVASEPAIASQCEAEGTAYRFEVPITQSMINAHGGRALYVDGLSPLGQHRQLAGSGVHLLPPPEAQPQPPAPNYQAEFVEQSVPDNLIPGEYVQGMVKIRNTSDAIWTAAQGYALGSYAPLDNMRWGFHRVPVVGAIAPGEEATFLFTIGVPVGTPFSLHRFQWQMVRDGHAWFGPPTPEVLIGVDGPDRDPCEPGEKNCNPY